MSSEAQSQNRNVNCENHINNDQQCAICQEPIPQNKVSFVDLCLHQYCFECLKKWCEVRGK